jgi:lysophospholipase L1-like esterase
VKTPLIVACVLLIAACGERTPPRSPVTPDPARLVVVGDSLAAGRFADTPEQAFPQLLATAEHAQLELVAVPGFTAAQLATQAVPRDAQIVVVEAGTNDFLRQTPRRQFAADFRALLAKVTAASPGAKLACATMWIPFDGKGLPPAKVAPASYNATIRRACTAVADITALFNAQPATRGPEGRITFLGPSDDFHPNSTGHAAIARAIEAALR